LQGQIVDPRVGRDVLAGFAGGVAIALLFGLRWPLQQILGYTGVPVDIIDSRFFEGPGYAIGLFSSIFAYYSVFNAAWCIFAIVGFKRLLKRMWRVAIFASLFFTLVAASSLHTDQPGVLWMHVALAVTIVAVIILLAIHYGLLATAVAFLVTNWTLSVPWTIASDRWDFPLSALAFGLLASVAAFGAWAARAPQAQTSR
jgi:hypothetical protein